MGMLESHPWSRRGGGVDAHLDWAGYSRLRTEVGDSLTVNGILLVVEGDEKLGGLAEMLNGSVPREEEVLDKELGGHEGP